MFLHRQVKFWLAVLVAFVLICWLLSGVLLPFVGIKLIDVVITALRFV